jgi:putative AlgH/UPF0301 family transcriptional regulator
MLQQSTHLTSSGTLVANFSVAESEGEHTFSYIVRHGKEDIMGFIIAVLVAVILVIVIINLT